VKRLLLCALIILFGCGPAQPHFSIVFLGDSITQSWNLANAFPYLNAINAGISGETTTQMLTRFERDVIQKHPTYLVILAGTNDLYMGVSLSTTQANIEQMIALARSKSIQPILCSVLPTSPKWYDRRPPEMIIALNRWLESRAAAYGLQYVNYYPHFLNNDALLLSGVTLDGLHPNTAGYDIMRPVLASITGWY
jgi:lysophospholipase L1-like esterase